MRAGRLVASLSRAFGTGRHVAATLGIGALIIEYGFGIPAWAVWVLRALEGLIVLLFVCDSALTWLKAADRRGHARRHLLILGLTGILALGVAASYLAGSDTAFGRSLAALELPSLGMLLVVAIQAFLLFRVLAGLTGLQEWLVRRQVRPEVVMIGSFAATILLGTLLLCLPRVRAPDSVPLSAIDALFTATSAVCVTGLATRDPATAFSPFGQVILLFLIQIGGLGLVVFTAFFSILRQRSLGLRHLIMMRDILSYQVIGELGRYIRSIVLITILAELVGAALLWQTVERPGWSFLAKSGWCLFHSVSAFCNAGFSLNTGSFTGEIGNFGLNAVLIMLIVLGGIGFPVLLNLLNFRLRSLAILRRRRPLPEGQAPWRMTLHAKLALLVSALLILGGGLLFWLLERRGVLAGRPLQEQVLVSVFQSVSCRTAGFNTVEIGALATPTLLFAILLMAIGASPASTGGGVKTVTIAVLWGTAWSMIRNRDNVELFRRTVPRFLVNATVTIVLLYSLEVMLVTMLLTGLEPDLTFRQLLFESVSALSTVGLSTGVTAALGVPSKVVLCLAMLAGRVGPLAVLMGFLGRAPTAGYEFPSEEVLVA